MSTKEHWKVIQHSWREIGIYSPTRQIAMIDIENSFDVSEDNQDECERIALMQATMIAAAPELLEALEAALPLLHVGDELPINYYKDKPSVLGMALRAIAKAKGE